MSGNFVKLYGTILDSSIWGEPHATVRLWITLLAMADQNGAVNASVGGLTRRANLTREECETALSVLLAPDPDSKSPEHEGRRIEAIDGGWLVLNHRAYRDLRTDKQIEVAERQRRFRERHANAGALPVTHVTREAEAYTEVDTTNTEEKRKGDYPADFDALLWKPYPRREGDNPKRAAFKAYNARLAEGVDFTVMQDGLARYDGYVKRKGWVGTDYVMQASRFFGPDKPFLNEYAVASASTEVVKLWTVIKTYGFASATRFTIEADLSRAVADGKLTDGEAFKRTLNRLNRSALKDTRSDEAAHKIIAEGLAGNAPEGLAA